MYFDSNLSNIHFITSLFNNLLNQFIHIKGALDCSSMLQSDICGVCRAQTMKEEDDESCIIIKSVKLPIFTGSHVEFQTWWFQFHAFATVWNFVGAVGKLPEVDLPSSEPESFVMNLAGQTKGAKSAM